MEIYKAFDKKTRSGFRKRHRKGDDPHHVVVCPSCGSNKVRPISVSVLAGKSHTHITHEGTHCRGDDPVGWGTTINLSFQGECGHSFIINYQFYDQETEFSVVSTMDAPSDSADPPIHWEPEEPTPRGNRS